MSSLVFGCGRSKKELEIMLSRTECEICMKFLDFKSKPVRPSNVGNCCLLLSPMLR